MQVGIYCSSNKPHLWDSLYQTLSQNNVDFNLCIAGPYPPIDELPGNVKYIQTNVKPAQCFFIAANNVKGDYITPMSDDIIFSPGFLDDMVRLIDEGVKGLPRELASLPSIFHMGREVARSEEGQEVNLRLILGNAIRSINDITDFKANEMIDGDFAHELKK